MKPYLPDDIARLTSDAGFEFDTYRSFVRKPRLAQLLAVEDEQPQVPPKLEEHHSMEILALSSALEAARVRESSVEAMLQRNGLTAATDRDTVQVVGPKPRSIPGAFQMLTRLGTVRPKIKKTTVALFSSSGGCGVTTIVATLGRLLSQRDEPVLLVDGASESLLGAHFGASASRPGVLSIVRSSGEGNTTVHIVNPADVSTGDWLGDSTRQLAGGFERMIVDVSLGFSAASLAQSLSHAVVLMPLTPDLRCVCGIEPMLAKLAAIGAASRVKPSIALLLCQFDPSVRLHSSIREWLQVVHGPSLLPFTLRRADEVSEALADGKTVIDYAPDSGIAADFRCLGDWVQRLPQPESWD